MKKLSKIMLVSTLALSLLPFAVFVQASDEGASSGARPEMTREERRAAWEALSDEEKQAKRDEMRAKREQARADWESLTPEEREAKRAEMKAKWEAMTPEQREAMKNMRKQRQNRGGQRKNHGGKKEQSQ